MMQIRCQRCGWNFTLGRNTIGLSVAEANQDHLEYTQFICPNCRHEVKVQVEVLRRHLPMDYVLPIPQPKPEPVAVHKEESMPAAASMAKPVAKPVKRAGSIEMEKAAAPAPKKQSGDKKIAKKKSVAKKPAATKLAAKQIAASPAKKPKK